MSLQTNVYTHEEIEGFQDEINAIQSLLDEKLVSDGIVSILQETYDSCTNGEYSQSKSFIHFEKFSISKHFMTYFIPDFNFQVDKTGNGVTITATSVGSHSVSMYSKITIYM